MGFVFLTGIIVLVIVVSLRFIRRAADPDLHGYGRRKPTRGFERGRGRDPWSEAGRRMVIPPLPIAGDGHIPIDGGDRRDGPADDGRHGHPGDDGSDGEGGSDDGGGADGGGSDGGGGGDGGGGDGGGGSD